ncbi:MAG: BLUF domain-containing protein [Proteobacteria bacterium]|nr:BLUF domain-containing protein [Pseudomonadota bacterium]
MHDTKLLRLAYVSCSQIDSAGIQAIMTTAHRRNPELQITGSLVFTGQYFFQTLEGPEERVDEMFCQICGDDRHFGVIKSGVAIEADAAGRSAGAALISPDNCASQAMKSICCHVRLCLVNGDLSLSVLPPIGRETGIAGIAHLECRFLRPLIPSLS